MTSGSLFLNLFNLCIQANILLKLIQQVYTIQPSKYNTEAYIIIYEGSSQVYKKLK